MPTTAESMAWLTRRDGNVLVGHGPFTPASTPPANGVAFYLQDFALQNRQPWQIPTRSEKLDPAGFAARFAEAAPIRVEWQTPDAAPFSVVFQEVMSSIHSGIFEKTVPVVTEKGQATGSIGPAIRAASSRQTLPLQSYGWFSPATGFAGATPELLLALRGNRLETMALAGTARSEDQDAFAVDEKEIREHEYVAQTLVAKLLDLGKLDRHAREILDLGPIVHFLSRIELELNTPLSPHELIQRLHPTPALGPLPRTDVTMKKLLEWRQRLGCPPAFGSPFGVWDCGEFCSVVAIRGLWWFKDRILIPSGCGVIEASRLVNEWRELRLKREAVKRFLDPVQGIYI